MIKINPTIKHALISILIGAAVAFATSLLEGLLGLLQTKTLDVSGGIISGLWYLRILRIVKQAEAA